MSYLYDHRQQLGDLQRLAEIAYSATYGERLPDRDDLEQDIVLAMIAVIAKRRDANKDYLNEDYLWGVARLQIKRYWTKMTKKTKPCCSLYTHFGDGEDDDEEPAAREDIDIDSRLDAMAILATLPDRLLEIGYKRLHGIKLNSADEEYWVKTKRKLMPEHKGCCYLSDEDKRRIERLYKRGLSVYKIAKTMDRSGTCIRKYLRGAGLRQPGPVPSMLIKKKPIAQEEEAVLA